MPANQLKSFVKSPLLFWILLNAEWNSRFSVEFGIWHGYRYFGKIQSIVPQSKIHFCEVFWSRIVFFSGSLFQFPGIYLVHPVRKFSWLVIGSSSPLKLAYQNGQFHRMIFQNKGKKLKDQVVIGMIKYNTKKLLSVPCIKCDYLKL